MTPVTSTEVLNFFADLSSAIFSDHIEGNISIETRDRMQAAMIPALNVLGKAISDQASGFQNRHVLDEFSDEHETDDEYSGGHHWDREDFCRGT